MPLIDLKCPGCGHVWEVLTTIAHSKRCPTCDVDGERVFTPRAPQLPTMRDSKNMTEGEIALALDHKRDVERGVASGELDVTVKGPREFRPDIPRRHY